jgi:hypothetical protein
MWRIFETFAQNENQTQAAACNIPKRILYAAAANPQLPFACGESPSLQTANISKGELFIMGTFKSFLNSILNMIPDILFAIILLIVAFYAAKIVKKLVIKLFGIIKADALLAKVGIKDDAAKNAKEFIAKLVYFVTFLLFLPGVLDKLGMHSVSTPIVNLTNSFLSFLPKLVAAGLILAIGIFVANIVKDLLLPVLKATKVDKLQEKTGIQATEKTSFSNILTNVVYGFILLIVITSALDQLGVAAISAPTNAIVSAIFAAIPNVLGAIIIIALGVFISNLVANLLGSLLAGIGTDSLIEKITGSPAKKVQLSKVISTIVKYLMVIIFLVQGINVLKLPVLAGVGELILSYVPTAISIVLILGLGIFAANTAEKVITSKFPKAKAGAFIAKAVIYVVLGFICMSQLGIANKIVESTFILIIASLCFAFAVSFGFGGKGFAANQLEKLEKKLDFDDSNKAE